jgi:hypothetical protein
MTYVWTTQKEPKIATYIIIEWGVFQLHFTPNSFHRTKTGGFGKLKKGQPQIRRTDRGEDRYVPPVPFQKAVSMVLGRFYEDLEKIRKARGEFNA